MATDLALARALYANKQTPIDSICRTLKVSRATLYRYLAADRTDGAVSPEVGP